MADKLDSVAHPDPEVVHSPPMRTAKRSARRRFRWLHVITLTITLLGLMPNLGLLSPVISPLVYASLAPQGWHNATPHGTLALDGFGMSSDIPGLAFACATDFTFAWPAPWSFGRMRYWRSVDGGAHWQMFQPPFASAQVCDLAIPPGGNGTVLAAVASSYNSGPTTLWVSHDAGASWRQVVIVPAGDGVYSLDSGIHSVVYRNGQMYGDMGFGSLAGGETFGMSANDGATWIPLEGSPDRLEQQGWVADAITPDYRASKWWYRDLLGAASPPMLEHSEDNGATWTVVGPIGATALDGSIMLATSPLLPNNLCAGQFSGDASNVALIGSADDGRTWRAGTMPTTLRNIHGETTLNIAIGTTGDCYEGIHYGIGREPEEGNSHFGFLQLDHESSVLRYIPLTDDGNSLPMSVTYLPSGSDMPARLVTELDGTYPGWAPVFGKLAAETTEGQIVWRAVP